ncbi:D-cysteine desulfhydrase [Pseudohalocynthiibacter aestuariivivens]|jgi:L-cysteate sulfo-lyase|uniref:D-cysteine desulfhydrase n=1 Tax=Pseudohalocynthiibacter aestuariivivens TaxID=1591409 RepID=A0ABV5JJN6_9RHOB|nr:MULTISPECIES: D-cysteine desulfhydrase [Pseudohalocynthiibacter]MBS9717549.1 D-cysteine desulfhydrase [Pseudohalocynthiibacter aestuariivivens]MCK0102734.1 D-cysteine desulfhydrase [Pseudohalocynthiibacter sp. F2068]
MHLARFPRVKLGHFPTPLEKLDNLTKALGGPDIYIKRDDCTGLATGGNKTRKLEFLVADAMAKGADALVTQGATQSNHVRQTAAAARKVGMTCHALLERRVENAGDNYETTGNVLLDDMLRLEYAFRPNGSDMNTEAMALADSLREKGKKPYFIPGGGSNPVGALGYAQAAAELVYQADTIGLKIDKIVHATGSAGTQAGLLAGLHAISAPIDVIGISVRAKREAQIANVHRLAVATADLIGVKAELPVEMVEAYDEYVGPGYGQPTDSMVDAISLLAAEEAIILDPVYSGKGMAGMIGLIQQGVLKKGETVVFIHTGGSAALFAYEHLFSKQRRG